jgi:choline monooxygenase
MPNPIFEPAQYASTRLPLNQASPLPGWCYTSPEWYQRELDTMFRKDWLCVGRAEQVPNMGDYYSIEVIGQPLIVVRDETKQVRVQSALCRHRGAIITQTAGKTRAFACPYHSWTYTLSGKLVGTPGNPPPMAGVECFDKEDHGLTQIRTEVWGGFIFITFNEKAPPLREWLGDLPQFLQGYDLENMVWTNRDTYEVACNWKVWLENAFENYHVATIHRQHYDPVNPQNWQFLRTRGPWEAMSSTRSIVAYSGLPPIPGLDPGKESTLYHIWIQPSLQIILTSSYMKFRQYLPEGPDKLRLYENWTFPRATVEMPGFDKIVGADYYEKYSQVVREDIGINPNVQKAMGTGAYRPGRYSLEEYVVHRIANRVLDRVIGPDEEGARRVREGDVAVQEVA